MISYNHIVGTGKGAPVLVAGRLVIRKYADKNKGERTTIEVVASDVNTLARQTTSSSADENSEEFPSSPL